MIVCSMLVCSFLYDRQVHKPTPTGMTMQIKLNPNVVIAEDTTTITSSGERLESGNSIPSKAMRLMQIPMNPGNPHNTVVATTVMILVVFLSIQIKT